MKVLLRIIYWAMVAAVALVVAWFLLLIVSIIGYELGLWGPPFGGE